MKPGTRRNKATSQQSDSDASRNSKETKRLLVESTAAYGVFCGLGLSSRFIPSMFLLFVAYGLLFPLAWAKITRQWGAIGFTKQNAGKALLLGVIAGVAWGAYTYIVFGSTETLPPLWALQVTISLPVWFLIMSPFQEFFFRGWLQSRLQVASGKLAGLLITSLAFTLWHFFPPFEGTLTAALPISLPVGILSTFLASLLFGYIYQRTENIIAPWVAHTIGGVALVLIGKMSFIQYVP